MKILIDMNLPPHWAAVLSEQGFEAVHWSSVGAPDASDYSIMEWARENNCIVFTHDLDFGAILAATKAEGPSVIQVRTQNVLVEYLGEIVVSALRVYEEILREGALVVIDEVQSRARILPLG